MPDLNTSSSQRVALDDERRVKVLSPAMLVFKRFIRNSLAIVGVVLIGFMFIFSFAGGWLMPYSETQVFTTYKDLVKDYAGVTEKHRFPLQRGRRTDVFHRRPLPVRLRRQQRPGFLRIPGRYIRRHTADGGFLPRLLPAGGRRPHHRGRRDQHRLKLRSR
jgi:hypothetical protein